MLLVIGCLTCAQAAEREYVISNLSRLLDSYQAVDFKKGTDETIDPIKYNCAIQVNAFNQQQSNILKGLFDQLNQGKISEDDLLRSVLDIRFRNINFFQRHKGFKFDPKINPFAGMHMSPGSSILCNKLKVAGGFSLIGDDYAKYIVWVENGGVLLRFIPKREQANYDKFGTVLEDYERITDPSVREVFSPLINDNLYVLTQIILGIFSLRPPSYFSQDTFDYIKASRSLWPLLGKVALGAEDPFLIDDDVSLFGNRGLLEEYEIYAICLLKIANLPKVTLKGLGCIPSRDYISILDPSTLKDSGFIPGDWSLPELPTTLEKLRTPQALDNIPPSIPNVSDESKSAKNDKTHMVSQSGRKQKAKQRQRPINAKRFAQVEEQMASSHAQSDTVEEAPLIEPASSPAEATESTLTTVSETESNIHSQVEHIFTGWSKKLRAKSNLASIAVRTDLISSEHLNVLKNIFGDNTRITYEVFENLWHHLNGPNSIKRNNKRSHRRLLDSQGMVVGDIFVLYGAQHRYSDKNKEQLEGALTLIGYGQDYLASLEKN